MKKIIISICMVFTILTASMVDVEASSFYMKNDNNIKITYDEYTKLQVFGFTDEEIMKLAQDEFDKFISREILSSYQQKVNLETVYTFENDELISQVDTVLTDEEMEVKVKEHKDKKVASILYAEEQIISALIIDDGGGGSTADIIRTKYESTTYKTFYMYGVYYADQGNYGEFYLRITLDWKITPSKRYIDVITVGFMDNVMLKEKYISGQYYPDIHSEFSYTETYSASYVGTVVTDYLIEVDGDDYNDYNYDHNEGLLGVEYDLPADNGAGGGGYYFSYSYSDFYMKLEAEWTTTVSSINGTTFSGWYSHQIGLGYIDWGNISVSPAPPYFSYSTSFWVNDPSFDEGIGGHIIFQDIG